MENRYISNKLIARYQEYLVQEEKSRATIEKYSRDIKAFASYVGGTALRKEKVIEYKQHLLDNGYAVSSINSMLVSLNNLFTFLGWIELRVKLLKIQKQAFCREEKELSREEYERLCRTAKEKHNERLYLILQTICCTGIRVSELEYITVKAVNEGKTTVSLKGKIRSIFLINKLQKLLKEYVSAQKIHDGCVFITKSGKPVSRSNIWREMKALCAEANVNPEKVFPHNLRHLFARVFYNLEKDIVKLADILGHTSINTTRLYVITTGYEHRQRMELMHLIL